MAFRKRGFHLFLLILVFPSMFAAGQTNCPIKINTALSAGGNDPPWLSPSQEFAFGFRPLQRADNDEDLFLLSIWLNKLPEQTIVWSKNDHRVQPKSRIHLTDDGQLVLKDPKDVELWRAEIEVENGRSTCAALLDSGNLVLYGDTDSSPIWESFSFPTDTILPGQNLTMGGTLTSRTSDVDYRDGRFQLRMQNDGNLVLYTIFLPTEAVNSAYWASRTVKPNSNSHLIFYDAGYMYIQQNNTNVRNITNTDMGSSRDFYFLARLDSDGVFRHYQHPRTNYAAAGAGTCTSQWSVIQTTPDDICRAIFGDVGSGACGYNSYCVNSNGRPTCFCPEGYSLVDPLNTYGGCKPDFPFPSCQKNGWETNTEFVDFKELNNTDWPLTDFELQTGSQVTKESCKELCLIDCFCAVAIYNGNNCWKKKFPLSNGRQFKDLDRVALIKVPRNNLTNSCPARNDPSTAVIVLSALLGSSVFLNFAILVVYKKKLLSLQSSTAYGTRMYTYKELEEASGGFKEHLGRGSFGTVYKGYVPSITKRFIAIKALDKVEKQGEKELRTEVTAIGQTHHKT